MPGTCRKALHFRALASGFALALVAAAVPAAATADGLPVLGVDVGSDGVAARTSPIRYVTLPTGGKPSSLERRSGAGACSASLASPGTSRSPRWRTTGSASGLSADAGTLVLIQPRLNGFPRARDCRSRLPICRIGCGFALLVTLRGDFSFDAISPLTEGTLFLIHYVFAFVIRPATRVRGL